MRKGMTEINIDADLDQVQKQQEQLVGQLNTVNAQKTQLEQQIHNLNGIIMYLRGKQPENVEPAVMTTIDNNEEQDE